MHGCPAEDKEMKIRRTLRVNISSMKRIANIAFKAGPMLGMHLFTEFQFSLEN